MTSPNSRQKSPEARFIQSFRENILNSRMTRIESRVGLGTPDAIVALSNGRIVLIEYKVVKPNGVKVRLSPHQVSFMMRHASFGAPVFLMVLKKRTVGIRGGMLYVYEAGQAMEVFEHGLEVKAALCHQPDINGGWARVEQFLLNWQPSATLPVWAPPLKFPEIAAADGLTDEDYDPDAIPVPLPPRFPVQPPATDPVYLRLLAAASDTK